jgi:hypothetical protein
MGGFCASNKYAAGALRLCLKKGVDLFTGSQFMEGSFSTKRWGNQLHPIKEVYEFHAK